MFTHINMLERIPQDFGRHLIIYDGVCGLCNRLNGFVLRRDSLGLFHFVSIQSALGRSLIQRFGRNPDDLDTFFVIANYRSETPLFLERARAGLFVQKHLGTPWNWMNIFGFLPDWLLNIGYNFIARHRYQIFGRLDTCLLPSAKYKSRFIDI